MKNINAVALYKKVLERNKYCIISTASLEGKTESAVMNYAETKGGGLYLYCFNNMRKYPHLKENPKVSVVIYNHPDYVQMDGAIKFLRGKEAKKARAELIKKHDDNVYYHTDSRCVYFSFNPEWIRIRTDEKFPAKYEVIKDGSRNPDKTLGF